MPGRLARQRHALLRERLPDMVSAAIRTHDDVAEIPGNVLIVRLRRGSFPTVFGTENDLETLVRCRQLDARMGQIATDEARPDILVARQRSAARARRCSSMRLRDGNRRIEDVPGNAASLTAPANRWPLGSRDGQ